MKLFMRKWIFVFILILTIAQLRAEQPRLAAESEPLLTVADCVNVMDGSFFQVNQDMIIDGPVPLSYTRYYDSGDCNYDLIKYNHYGYGVGLGYPLMLKYIKAPNRNVYISVDQRYHYGVFFNLRNEGKLRKGYFHPDMFRYGYTNCTAALERGNPSLAHTEIFLHKSSDIDKHVWDVIDTDGTKRVYTFFKTLYNLNAATTFYRYILQRTVHPNGLTTHYHYNDDRLSTVSLKNTSDDELLTAITFNYDDQQNTYSVSGSDGSIVYHSMSQRTGYFDRSSNKKVSTPFLMGISGTALPQKVYWYATPPNNNSKTLPLLVKIDNPNGGFLYVNYQNEKQVTSLSATLGTTQETKTLYSFDYQKSRTIVTNGLGAKNTYIFDNRRLIALVEADLRIRKYLWSEKGQLNCKSLCDGYSGILESINFMYDQFGNIIYKHEWGNITGDAPDCYDKNDHRLKGCDKRQYSYTYGPLSTLTQEISPNGTITTYGYKEGTNLRTSKLVSWNGVIQEREFYKYDKNAILIEKFHDDGNSENRDEISNVTYRLITRIQPQMDRTRYGLTKPAVEEELYLDLNTGEGKLLKRVEYEYAREGAQLSEKRVYDATASLAYQESFHYNQNFLLEEKCDGLGRVTRYGYDACNNVIYEELLGSGKKVIRSYDLCNRLIEEKELHDDGLSLTTSYGYDVLSNLTSKTDHNGFTTQYVYDQLNRRIQEIDPYGYQITTKYDLRDNPIATTDKEGNITTARYNIDHHPIKIDYPDGTVEEFRYYIDGTLKSKKEKDGTSIGYTYDYRGRILTESRYDKTGALLTTKSYLYKGENLIAETDPKGYVTSYSYDSAKRLIAKTREGVTETYGYDALGRQCVTTKGGKVILQVFDSLNRPLEERVEDLAGRVFRRKTLSYDIYDNVCKEEVDTGDKIIETLSVYNSRNLPILKVDGMKNQTTISYNYRPFQKATVDPLGQMTIENYDALNRLISTEIPGLMKQEVVYSPNGHRIKQIDHIYQQGVVTGLSTVAWKYDAMGNPTSIVEQDLKQTRHTYRDGRLDTTTKPDGVILTHTYDLLGRLKEQSSSDGSICTQYSYDLNGNMLSAYDKVNDIPLTRTYDAYSNITSETTHTTLYYSYDELNRLTEIAFPDSTVNYAYSPADLIAIDRQSKMHTYEVDLAGRLIQENTFDGTTTFYSYNDNHHLTSITSPVYRQTFLYDAADNITSTTINNETTNYAYDGLYQLIAENTTAYTYDSLYNRLTKDNRPYEHNTLHQVLSDHENIYTYDRNGNRLTKNGITYTYDALNRLKSAGEVSYSYDPLGRLQTRTSPSSQESYLYYKDNDLGTLDNMRILGKGTAALEQNGQLYSVIRDHRGSPSMILCDGYSVATYTYTAFGDTTHTGSVDSPWQYSAHRCDADTQLLHAPKRIYDPYIGRWLTPDPLGFADGPNLYAYVHNNPLIFIDPTGLWASSFWESTKTTAMDTFRHPRVQGGLQAFGGLGEMGFGASMTYTTGGIAAPIGWLVLSHGMDNFFTGMEAMMTGVPRDTFTSNLIQRTGVSRDTANLVDTGISLAGSMAGAWSKSFQTSASALKVPVKSRLPHMESKSSRKMLEFKDTVSNQGGRNRFAPDYRAEGPHSVFRRDLTSGKVEKYQTYWSQMNSNNPNPWQNGVRYDGPSHVHSHFNKTTREWVSSPHIHETSGNVRKPFDWEIPK